MRIIVRDLSNVALDYLPGDIIEAEPCSDPQPGCMMIAMKGGARILAPCGDSRLAGAAIVGVAIEHHKDLRNR